ncbi:hypothetical protein KIS4809_2340 [Bacillus sp. ZZV12-4809]|nr:hypothetical protein KIS4809_2340 [Bacillus sp. ZZV12-4809]
MKISVMYMGNINALNGASKVVKSFFDNEKEFGSNDIEMENVYTPTMEKVNFRTNKSPSNSYKSIIKKALAKTMMGSIVSIYLQYFRNGRRSIKNYINHSNKTEDVLIFHDIFSCYIYYKKFNKNAKKSILVLHTNGDTWKMIYEYFPSIKKPFFMKKLIEIEEFVCEKTNKIVFVSETSMENFIERKSKYKNKTTYIYNGIEKLGNTNTIKKFDNLELITVGTLNSRKAQGLILEALKRINDKTIKLSIVGDGEKREELLSYVKENNLIDQVQFLGSRGDVVNLLNRHNVFIMSSKDEGLPISIIEAMRCKLPIIATDVGGIKELIQENGILVKPNVESITSALEQINKNKEILSSFSESSYSIFQSKFEVNKMVESYSNLVKEVYYEEYIERKVL